ncbi:MAG: hypothetical protein COB69_08955 [Phycisphaera sp.]|nr:MAG: hypothetical protein COB69_08955 [Phycisphaera sp.]
MPLHRIHQLKSGGLTALLREDAGTVADLTFGDQQLANLDALEICAEIQPPCDPCVLVDVNGDGIVNASDFTAWINAFNNNLPGCDQNCDGVCTPADFTAWIANFNACP